MWFLFGYVLRRDSVGTTVFPIFIGVYSTLPLQETTSEFLSKEELGEARGQDVRAL